jgi:hypothetical protein
MSSEECIMNCMAMYRMRPFQDQEDRRLLVVAILRGDAAKPTPRQTYDVHL